MEKISKIIPPNRRTQPEVLTSPAPRPGVFKSRRVEEQKLEKSMAPSRDQALREATLVDTEALGELAGNSLEKIDRFPELPGRPSSGSQDRLTISAESRIKALDKARLSDPENETSEKLTLTPAKEVQGYEKMKESQRAQMVENLSKRFFSPQAQINKKSQIDDESVPKSKRLAEQVARNEQLANG